MTPPAPSPSGRIVRRRPARPRRLLVLVAAVLVAACGGPAGPGGATAAPDGDWLLRSGTSGTSEVPIIEGHDITLTIDGDDWGDTELVYELATPDEDSAAHG